MLALPFLTDVAGRLRREAELRPICPALWRVADPRHTCELPDGKRLIFTSSYRAGQRVYHLCVSHAARPVTRGECYTLLKSFFPEPDRVRSIEPRLNPRARHFEYSEPASG